MYRVVLHADFIHFRYRMSEMTNKTCVNSHLISNATSITILSNNYMKFHGSFLGIDSPRVVVK